jgi:hypothetical protein
MDINSSVEEALMEGDDIDDIIEAQVAAATKKGYDYVSFYHPSASGHEESEDHFLVVIPTRAEEWGMNESDSYDGDTLKPLTGVEETLESKKHLQVKTGKHPTRDDLRHMKVHNCIGMDESNPTFTGYRFSNSRSAAAAQQKIGGKRIENTLILEKSLRDKPEPTDQTDDWFLRARSGAYILRKSYHSRHDLGERGHKAFERRVQSGKISLISAKGMQKIKERTERQNYVLHKPAIEDLPAKEVTPDMMLPPANPNASVAEEKWYIKKFLSQFGCGFDDKKPFVDKSGESVIISKEMFINKEESRLHGRTIYKATKRAREQYLLLLADTIKNPTEIWVIKPTPASKEERRYISVYKNTTGEIAGYAVFHHKGGEWVGVSTYSPDDLPTLDGKRKGKLVYIAEKPPLIKSGFHPAFKSPDLGARPSREVSGTSLISISTTDDYVNKSLAGVYLIKSLILQDPSTATMRAGSLNQTSSGDESPATDATNNRRNMIFLKANNSHNTLQKSDKLSANAGTALAGVSCVSMWDNTSLATAVAAKRNMSFHNNLQDQNIPAARVKSPEHRDLRKGNQRSEIPPYLRKSPPICANQPPIKTEHRDLSKAHVAAYDRVTKTGAIAHIEAHEDSRVRRYAIKLQRTKNSAELHKLRTERFAHLPHWGNLDEHTKQAVLDAEDEQHADHKHFEEWVAKRKDPKKTDAPSSDKIDRSGWEQNRLFKAWRRTSGLFLLRKSQMQPQGEPAP